MPFSSNSSTTIPPVSATYRFVLVSLLFFFSLKILPGCTQEKKILQGNISFLPLADSLPDLQAPGRGAEQWHDQYRVSIPTINGNGKSLDKYYRFSWVQLEKGPGQYDWSLFDQEINDAIANGQKFSFGIMAACPSCTQGSTSIRIDGKIASYPLYLHQQMQNEPIKDWVTPISEMWVPNWNSPSYLTALEKLNAALNQHLQTGSFNGVPYKNVINYIDVRGYGSYGEWHESGIVENMTDHPAGTRATTASLQRIIDAHVQGFPEFQLVALLACFDANMLRNTANPPEIGYYALTVSNKKGKLGLRRDNWGATDNYLSRYLDNNPGQFKGLKFQQALSERWKIAPVVGEPIHGGAEYNGCEYGDLENQVRRYHASLFGNGNYAASNRPCMQQQVIAASRAAGYRLLPEGGNVDSAAIAGDTLTSTLFWRNAGVAPSYDAWQVSYTVHDLRTDSLLYTVPSRFQPRLFLPADTAQPFTDRLFIPASLPEGNYNLRLIVRDMSGYRQPLPLAISGRQEDGSYPIRTIQIIKRK